MALRRFQSDCSISLTLNIPVTLKISLIPVWSIVSITMGTGAPVTFEVNWNIPSSSVVFLTIFSLPFSSLVNTQTTWSPFSRKIVALPVTRFIEVGESSFPWKGLKVSHEISVRV